METGFARVVNGKRVACTAGVSRAAIVVYRRSILQTGGRLPLRELLTRLPVRVNANETQTGFPQALWAMLCATPAKPVTRAGDNGGLPVHSCGR